MDNAQTALAFSPRFYKAALDHSEWPSALRHLRLLLTAEFAQMNLARASDATVLATFDDGLTDEQRRLYLSYSGFNADPLVDHARLNPFRPFHCRQVFTDEKRYSTDFYKKLLVPWGYDYILAYPFFWEGNDMAVVTTFTRAQAAGPFTQDDLDHFSLYVPHLRRSLEVMMTMMTQRSAIGAFKRAFDVVEEAVVIVDRFSRPQHVNPAARAILDQGRALSDANGPLWAIDGPTTERLRAAILELGLAAMTGSTPVPFSGGSWNG